MAQFSMEIMPLPGSLLGGNQHPPEMADALDRSPRAISPTLEAVRDADAVNPDFRPAVRGFVALWGRRRDDPQAQNDDETFRAAGRSRHAAK